MFFPDIDVTIDVPDIDVTIILCLYFTFRNLFFFKASIIIFTGYNFPFKDTQCTDCVNNSLLIDALIVSKVKGIKRRMTENILNSLCPTPKKSESNVSRNNES